MQVGPCPGALGGGECQDDVFALAEAAFAGDGAHRIPVPVAGPAALAGRLAATVAARHASPPLIDAPGT